MPKPCNDCGKKVGRKSTKRCMDCNIDFMRGKNHPAYRHGKRTITKRKCLECTKTFNSRRKFCSDVCKNIDISKRQTGNSNPNWKGGTTSLRKRIYDSKKNTELLKESKKRDNYQCLMPGCDSDSNKLESNHIKRFATILKQNNIKTLKQAYNCPELWDINNLITLCKPCHKHIRGREEEFEKLFSLIIEKLYFNEQ